MLKLTAFLLVVAACAVSAAPSANSKNVEEEMDIGELSNKLFPYETMKDSSSGTIKSRSSNNIIPMNSFDLERESSSAVPSSDGSSSSDSVNMDKIKSIAFNSREVRLVGPDHKAVEVKDDVATKMVIALENLQKEATEVWGTVNEKLDKGWTDFKSAIEGVIAKQTGGKKIF